MIKNCPGGKLTLFIVILILKCHLKRHFSVKMTTTNVSLPSRSVLINLIVEIISKKYYFIINIKSSNFHVLCKYINTFQTDNER